MRLLIFILTLATISIAGALSSLLRSRPSAIGLTILLGLFALALAAFPSPRVEAGNAPIVINNSTDTTSGNCNNNCTLRDAIITANNRDGPDTIRFSPGLANESFGVGPTLGNLPFIDASDGITIEGSGQTIRAVPYGSVDFGLVFATLGTATAQNITVSGPLSVNDFVWDAMQVCAGLVQGDGCYGPVDGVTFDGANAFDNGHNGIRILGTAISNVSISDLAINSSDEDAISIAATSDLTGIHLANIQATSSGSDGVSISGYFASDISVTGGNADENHEFGYHITADNLTGLSFQGAQANDNGQPNIVDVTGSLSNFTVAGSTFSGGHGGMYLSAGSTSTGTISGNTIEEHDGSGLVLNANNRVDDVTIENNMINDNNGTGFAIYSTRGTGDIFRGNTLHNNRSGVILDGVLEADSLRATISRNSIWDSWNGLGIDLHGPADQSGVTLNDDGDGDAGPNGLLNYPVFSSLNTDDQAVHGTACANCLVELFVADPDPTGYGEGKTFISDVMADGDGNFAAPICGTGLPGGSTYVTATATDALGNTSEFASVALQLTSAGVCPVTPTPSPTPTPTPSPTATPVGQTSAPTLVGQTPTPTPAGPTPSLSPVPTLPPNPLLGDVTCNSAVTIDDAKALLAFLATNGDGPPGCLSAASGLINPGDVNCSSTVNISDVLDLLRHIAGLPRITSGGGCTEIGEPLLS